MQTKINAAQFHEEVHKFIEDNGLSPNGVVVGVLVTGPEVDKLRRAWSNFEFVRGAVDGFKLCRF